MRRLYTAFFFGVVLTITAFGQNTSSFPASWEGKWKGTLEVYGVSDVVNEFPMELHILPIDSTGHHTWTLIYGEGEKRDYRPYELQTVDAEKGLYRIDEKNSIILEAYLRTGRLLSRFAVEDTQLLMMAEKVDDTLIFEIMGGDTAAVSTTGGTEFEGEKISVVEAFPMTFRQKAVLKKE